MTVDPEHTREDRFAVCICIDLSSVWLQCSSLSTHELIQQIQQYAETKACDASLGQTGYPSHTHCFGVLPKLGQYAMHDHYQELLENHQFSQQAMQQWMRPLRPTNIDPQPHSNAPTVQYCGQDTNFKLYAVVDCQSEQEPRLAVEQLLLESISELQQQYKQIVVFLVSNDAANIRMVGRLKNRAAVTAIHIIGRMNGSSPKMQGALLPYQNKQRIHWLEEDLTQFMAVNLDVSPESLKQIWSEQSPLTQENVFVKQLNGAVEGNRPSPLPGSNHPHRQSSLNPTPVSANGHTLPPHIACRLGSSHSKLPASDLPSDDHHVSPGSNRGHSTPTPHHLNTRQARAPEANDSGDNHRKNADRGSKHRDKSAHQQQDTLENNEAVIIIDEPNIKIEYEENFKPPAAADPNQVNPPRNLVPVAAKGSRPSTNPSTKVTTSKTVDKHAAHPPSPRNTANKDPSCDPNRSHHSQRSDTPNPSRSSQPSRKPKPSAASTAASDPPRAAADKAEPTSGQPSPRRSPTSSRSPSHSPPRARTRTRSPSPRHSPSRDKQNRTKSRSRSTRASSSPRRELASSSDEKPRRKVASASPGTSDRKPRGDARRKGQKEKRQTSQQSDFSDRWPEQGSDSKDGERGRDGHRKDRDQSDENPRARKRSRSANSQDRGRPESGNPKRNRIDIDDSVDVTVMDGIHHIARNGRQRSPQWHPPVYQYRPRAQRGPWDGGYYNQREGGRDVRFNERHPQRMEGPTRAQRNEGDGQPQHTTARDLVMQQRCITAIMDHKAECDCCSKAHPLGFVFARGRWTCNCKYCTGHQERRDGQMPRCQNIRKYGAMWIAGIRERISCRVHNRPDVHNVMMYRSKSGSLRCTCVFCPCCTKDMDGCANCTTFLNTFHEPKALLR